MNSEVSLINDQLAFPGKCDCVCGSSHRRHSGSSEKCGSQWRGQRVGKGGREGAENSGLLSNAFCKPAILKEYSLELRPPTLYHPRAISSWDEPGCLRHPPIALRGNCKDISCSPSHWILQSAIQRTARLTLWSLPVALSPSQTLDSDLRDCLLTPGDKYWHWKQLCFCGC